jgi:hypothetical protein
MFIAQRQAIGVFFLFILIANAAPGIAGGFWMSYQQEHRQSQQRAATSGYPQGREPEPSNFILDLVPGLHVVSWFDSSVPRPSPIPLVVAYTLLLGLTWRSLRKRLARMEAVIDRKLEAMGVRPVPMALPAVVPAS